MSDIHPKLQALNGEVADCTKCPLHSTRTNTVPGEGPVPADIMFIGEGPGKNEDLQVRPFVGAAGKLLEELLQGIGKSREEVFIANVVKCRPPGNRDPQSEEVQSCWSYLERQVALVDPKLVILLGRHAMDRFLPGQKISNDKGKPKRREITGLGVRVYMPIYHPAAALYNPNLKESLAEDFAKIDPILEKIHDLPRFESSRPQLEEDEQVNQTLAL